MKSLSTKVNKSRSPASKKTRSTKGKKAVKKPQRPGKITATPKSSKAAPTKTKKSSSAASKKAATEKKSVKASASKSVKKPAAKKAPAKRVVSKKTVAKKTPARKAPAKKAASRKRALKPVARKSKKAVAKKSAQPPKKAPEPKTLLAIRAFEQAMKMFNRQDFSAAKSAFDDIIRKFEDQAEVVAGARTFLTICEQRLSRAPSVSRKPDALYDQGVFEFNRGNSRGSVELFEKALKVDPRADHVLYSLAAAYARLSDVPKALDALRRAIALRSIHRSHARRDRDFASLRTNEDFQELTGFGFDLIEG